MGLKHDIDKEKGGAARRELTPSGSYYQLYLLFLHHFCNEMVNFSIIPCVFELTFHLSGHNPLNAALILAMTPLATSIYSLVLNTWVEYYFKTPMIASCLASIASAYLYSLSYTEKSLFIFLISRILFGIACS